MMYPRAFSNSADPAGRGPNSTCLRTCSNARSPSKSDFADDAGGGAKPSAGLLVLLGQPSRRNGTIRTNARAKKRDEFFKGSVSEESLIIVCESAFKLSFPFPPCRAH